MTARARRGYERLLRLFLPRDLRLEAEAEMIETFDAAYARVSHRSRPRRAVFWAGLLLDLVITGLSERIARRGGWLLDLKHVLRGLASSRSYTSIAILSLAIGIGANSAVFSVIRVLLLDPLPVRAPHELALVYWHHPGSLSVSNLNSSGYKDPASGLQLRSNYSYPMYESIRAAAPDGIRVAGFNFIRDASVQYGDGPAISAPGAVLADAAYFDVVSPNFALGRGITQADDTEGAEPVAVLGHRFWMRAFGGDPSIVGRTLRVNSVATRVIGITAAEFRGLSKGGFFPETDVTMPLRHASLYYPRWTPAAGSLFAAERMFWVRMIARVPGETARDVVSARLAQPLTPHLQPLLATAGGVEPARAWLIDARRGLEQTRPETRRLLYILMSVVGVVLAIACINLASLMLARGAARQREFSVRRALGGGRWRLVRMLVLEALVLAAAGGAGGLILTWWARGGLTTLLTAGLGTMPLAQQPLEVSIDARLIAATFGLTVVAALVFSLVPAWRLTGDSGTADLRQQVVGARSPKLFAGRVLVALQIAVTMPLLVGAVLFLRTMSELNRVDLGFDPEGLAYFRVDPSVAAVPAARHPAVYVQLLERVRAVPGVTSATLLENALLSGYTSNNTARVDDAEHSLFMNSAGPDFLETMGMRLLAGRVPGMQDGPGAPLVAALNETAARRLFGDTPPIGRTVTVGTRTIEIVGIVSDSRYDRQRAAVRPTMFDSALQRPSYGGHHVVIRSAVPIDRIEHGIRMAVASVHRDLPIPAFKTQLAHLEESTIRERVFTQVLSAFGVFTLLLASIGLYGVTAYAVRRRTAEIGVRMALGAQRGDVVWMIQRQVIVLAALGLAAGIPLSLLIAPLVESLLFGVAPRDITVIGVAAGTMLITAAGAGLVPARRAATLDPVRALRM